MCLKKILGLDDKKVDTRNDAVVRMLEEQRKQAKALAQQEADKRKKLKDERILEMAAKKRKGVGRRSLISGSGSGRGFLVAGQEVDRVDG